MQETQYYDGEKIKKGFDKIGELMDSVEEDAKDPNVKKIVITFPKRKIPSKKNKE
jgi:hypothetical protein